MPVSPPRLEQKKICIWNVSLELESSLLCDFHGKSPTRRRTRCGTKMMIRIGDLPLTGSKSQRGWWPFQREPLFDGRQCSWPCDRHPPKLSSWIFWGPFLIYILHFVTSSMTQWLTYLNVPSERYTTKYLFAEKKKFEHHKFQQIPNCLLISLFFYFFFFFVWATIWSNREQNSVNDGLTPDLINNTCWLIILLFF